MGSSVAARASGARDRKLSGRAGRSGNLTDIAWPLDHCKVRTAALLAAALGGRISTTLGGSTVDDRSDVGNARPFVFVELSSKRFLDLRGHAVTLADQRDGRQ